MLSRSLVALVTTSLIVACAPRRVEAQHATQASVPLIIEGNRPFVVISLRLSDGTTRTARFLLDTGGGGFLIVESLARELGLTWGPTTREEGAEFAAVTKRPAVHVGDFQLELNPDRTFVKIGTDNILPSVAPGRAEGMIPGHVLAQYHVVFDYPASTFTIAQPNVLVPEGSGLPMPVGKRSGFPRTEVTVDGATHGLLIDTGASFTMVSEELLKEWGSGHAEWPRHPGGFGEAAMLGGQTLETMFVPGATWGSNEIGELGVVSQRKGVFQRYMSGMMSAPIVGSLAGNVLKGFRVELDYPHERLYLRRGGR